MTNLEIGLAVVRLIIMYFILIQGSVFLREILRLSAAIIKDINVSFPGAVIRRPAIWGTLLYATYLFESFILNLI